MGAQAIASLSALYERRGLSVAVLGGPAWVHHTLIEAETLNRRLHRRGASRYLSEERDGGEGDRNDQGAVRGAERPRHENHSSPIADGRRSARGGRTPRSPSARATARECGLGASAGRVLGRGRSSRRPARTRRAPPPRPRRRAPACRSRSGDRRRSCGATGRYLWTTLTSAAKIVSCAPRYSHANSPSTSANTPYRGPVLLRAWSMYRPPRCSSSCQNTVARITPGSSSRQPRWMAVSSLKANMKRARLKTSATTTPATTATAPWELEPTKPASDRGGDRRAFPAAPASRGREAGSRPSSGGCLWGTFQIRLNALWEAFVIPSPASSANTSPIASAGALPLSEWSLSWSLMIGNCPERAFEESFRARGGGLRARTRGSSRTRAATGTARRTRSRRSAPPAGRPGRRRTSSPPPPGSRSAGCAAGGGRALPAARRRSSASTEIGGGSRYGPTVDILMCLPDRS